MFPGAYVVSMSFVALSYSELFRFLNQRCDIVREFYFKR